MTRPFCSILAGTLATAGLVAAVPAAQAATYSQLDPNEPIICVRCGALTQIHLPERYDLVVNLAGVCRPCALQHPRPLGEPPTDGGPARPRTPDS